MPIVLFVYVNFLIQDVKDYLFLISLSENIWFMKHKILFYFLLVFLLSDITLSFFQLYNLSLDGDIAKVVLPSTKYQTVMSDPLGIQVLKNDSIYPSPNRFFAHWTMSVYFKTIPFLLQHFMSPINSVYTACALAKLLIQLLIIWLLTAFITGITSLLKRKLIMVAAIICPLFQAIGFYNKMGIIDKSITYTFFYALPIGLLLLYFLPIYRIYFLKVKEKLLIWKIIILILLSFYLSLHGPLVPGIVLIACPLIVFIMWNQHYLKLGSSSNKNRIVYAFKKIPAPLILLFIIFCLSSLYSLYIGKNNAENFSISVDIIKRYALLPGGLIKQFSGKPGLVLLLILIMGNLWLMTRQKTPEASKLLLLYKWLGIFSLVFMLLLPLGGFRLYRPDIIRRDTFIPITILFFFVSVSSVLFLFMQLKSKAIYIYSLIYGCFLLIFFTTDLIILRHNTCEREAFKRLANASENVVELDMDCHVMSWHKFYHYMESENNATLLQYWNITQDKKLYYHTP